MDNTMNNRYTIQNNSGDTYTIDFMCDRCGNMHTVTGVTGIRTVTHVKDYLTRETVTPEMVDHLKVTNERNGNDETTGLIVAIAELTIMEVLADIFDA